MDYDKYYIERGGQYSVHFANKEGYSEDKIKDIFSEYGNVISVKIPGDAHGFCFVKYKKLNEIRSCLDGLQNNRSIRILKEKSKLSGTESKNENVRNTQKRNSNTNRNSNKKNRNAHIRSSTPARPFNNFENDRQDEHKSRSLDNYQTEYTDKKMLDADRWSDTSSVHSSTNHAQDTHQSSVPNKIEKNNFQFLKLQKLRGIQASTFSPSHNEETSWNKKEEADNTEIPALVCRENLETASNTSSSSSLPKIRKIVDASEVIVANIHSNFGIHYILHLLESHNPISVSLMNTTSKSSIRYCHVYFKTLEDALMVEKKFDKYLLVDKNLIVVRPQTLIPDLVQTH